MSTVGKKQLCASTKDMHYISGSAAAYFLLREPQHGIEIIVPGPYPYLFHGDGEGIRR